MSWSPAWHYEEMAETLKGGASRRSSEHFEPCPQVEFWDPGLFISFSSHNMRGLAPPWPPPMISQAPQWTQPIMTWDHEPKYHFVFISWFSQVVVLVTQSKTTQQHFLSLLLVYWGALDIEYSGWRQYTSWHVFLSLNSPVQSGSNSWASNQTWSFLPRILFSQVKSLPVLRTELLSSTFRWDADHHC
jgi:hypothetical protein